MRFRDDVDRLGSIVRSTETRFQGRVVEVHIKMGGPTMLVVAAFDDHRNLITQLVAADAVEDAHFEPWQEDSWFPKGE